MYKGNLIRSLRWDNYLKSHLIHLILGGTRKLCLFSPLRSIQVFSLKQFG